MTRALVLLLAGLAGCGFANTQFDGHSWTEKAGVHSVDGVPVPHRRWVPLALPVGGGSLRLASATEDTILAGSPDGVSHLEVQIFSEVENDGTARVDGGRVVVSSAAGRVVAMNGARGTLAPGVRLELSSGTGEQRLEGLPELGDLQCENGTGDVRLANCGAGDLEISSGTGDVSLEGVQAARLRVELGTGEARLAASSLSSISVSSGTGDVTFKDCTCPRTEVEAGTGDVLLEGENRLGTPRFELGTGSVEGG